MGAFRTGLRHGAYCFGGCWFLMALLFLAGVMKLFWIAGLAIKSRLKGRGPRVHGSAARRVQGS